MRDIENAFSCLSSAKVLCGKPELEVGIEFVLRRDNFHELPQVLEWAAQRGATFAIVSHILPYHQTLLSQIAYEYNSDQALELYGTWKSRAQAEGIALEEFHKVYFKFKFRYTDEELRLLFCAGKMLLDANKRGVFLQVKNLLAKEPSAAPGNGQDFRRRAGGGPPERACTETAGGRSQKRPQVRLCRRGGSYDFLGWQHAPLLSPLTPYSCYTKGRDTARKIDAKNFGHLESRNIGEIWNDADFRKFREEVVGYEFSWCSNCNVAPCGFIDNPDFVNDCYTNTVPCGETVYGAWACSTAFSK